MVAKPEHTCQGDRLADSWIRRPGGALHVRRGELRREDFWLKETVHGRASGELAGIFPRIIVSGSDSPVRPCFVSHWPFAWLFRETFENFPA
jgi:hypothetical protein